MGKVNFEVKEVLGVLGRKNDGTEIRLCKISWYGKEPVWDIRNWAGDIAKSGTTMSDEAMRNLKSLLNDLDL